MAYIPPEMPMVPVPEALETVLHQAAKIILQNSSNGKSYCEEEIKLTSDTSLNYSVLMRRILTRSIIAPKPGYPDFPASIMDGYAIKFSSWKKESVVDEISENSNKWTHSVTSTVYAGENSKRMRESNNSEEVVNLPEAAYVTTGAVVPAQFDTVVPIENMKLSEDGKFIRIKSEPTKKGHWIRPIGCDIPPDTNVLPAGSTITPSDIGVLLQLNIQSIFVRRKLRVGVLSTGNELYQPSTETSEICGHIPDINRPILLSLLSTAFSNSVVPVDLGIASDDLSYLETKLSNAFGFEMKSSENELIDDCDILVTSGGVSMGEKDLLLQILLTKFHATLHFGRLNMKPGKPTKFMTLSSDMDDLKAIGTERTRMILALPGNPVSALVCSHLLLCPMIHFLQKGSTVLDDMSTNAVKQIQITKMVQNAIVHDEIEAELSHDIVLDQGRPEYHRVILTRVWSSGNKEIKIIAKSTGVQRSSRIMSMCRADGLMCLPKGIPDRKIAQKGEKYLVLLLSTLGPIRNLWGSYSDGESKDINTMEEGTRVKHAKHMSIPFTRSGFKGNDYNIENKSTQKLRTGLVIISCDDNTQFSNVILEEFKSFDDFILCQEPKQITLKSTILIKEAEQFFLTLLHENYRQGSDTNLSESRIDALFVVNKTSSTSTNYSVPTQKGFLPLSTTLATALRSILQSSTHHKLSDAIAMKARQGASKANPIAGLMDVISGYFSYNILQKPEQTETIISNDCNSGGVLVILLSDIGLKGAFTSIQHLLPRAVALGRN